MNILGRDTRRPTRKLSILDYGMNYVGVGADSLSRVQLIMVEDQYAIALPIDQSNKD